MTNKAILILDDDKDITRLISIYLKEHGFLSVAFNDADSALEYLKDSEVRVLAMVVDLYMPKINGLDFIVKVKEKIEHRLTPIIFLTSETSENIKSMSLNIAGVAEYLTKPIDINTLISTVRKAIV